MNYFTADWHLGDDRIGINGKPNLFYRPFESVRIQDMHILAGLFSSEFRDGDSLFHLGDVIYQKTQDNKDMLKAIRSYYPNSEFTLIRGNYDTDDKIPMLEQLFDEIWFSGGIHTPEFTAHLNHYPSECIDKDFSITGHIHGLWKVQPNMINVGVDAWHFQPVSEEQIAFCKNAMDNHYDENVFPFTSKSTQ